MALTRTTAEQRDYLKILHDTCGSRTFQWSEVRDKVSKSMFKKFCMNNFVVKSGKRKIIYSRKDGRGNDSRYINNWKLDVAYVERYME